MLAVVSISFVQHYRVSKEIGQKGLVDVDTKVNHMDTSLPSEQTVGEVNPIAEMMANYLEKQLEMQTENSAVDEGVVMEKTMENSIAETVATPPWPGSPGVEQWRSIVASYGDWDTDRMLKIMSRESGGDPTNHPDGSYEYLGLFQIYDPDGWYRANAPWSDGAWNISCAHEAWLAHGYSPWASTDY